MDKFIHKFINAARRAQDRGGFTLVELMIVLVISLYVLYAASQMMTALMMQFKQQSKIAETSLEGVVGLDILRRDMHNAGFGIPHHLCRPKYCAGGVYSDTTDFGYNETVSAFQLSPNYTAASPTLHAALRDSTEDFNSPPMGRGFPRPITATVAPIDIIGDADATVKRRDYLVVRSMLVDDNLAAGKFTWRTESIPDNTWSPASMNMRTSSDAVLLLDGSPDGRMGLYVSNNGKDWFSTPFNATDYKRVMSSTSPNPGYTPEDDGSLYIVYGGIESTQGDRPPRPMRVPFNRADYYVTLNEDTTKIGKASVPTRCARKATGDLNGDGINDPAAGVLVKSLLIHKVAQTVGNNELPLLDCVLDFQVVYALDLGTGSDDDPDGIAGTYSDEDGTETQSGSQDESASGFTAPQALGRVDIPPQSTSTAPMDIVCCSKNDYRYRTHPIRQRMKEVRVYILAHEGQVDANYQYPADNIVVGPTSVMDATNAGRLGNRVQFDSNIQQWRSYRWKIYSIVESPIFQ